MEKVTDIIVEIIAFPFYCLFKAAEYLFEFAIEALGLMVALSIPVFLLYVFYIFTFGMTGLPFKFFIFVLIWIWLSHTKIYQVAMLVLIPLVTIIMAISGKI